MSKLTDNIKPILALLIILLSFTYFFSLLFIEGKENPQILIAIVGMVGGAIGYYFGSSSGTSKKDETINNLTQSNK